MDQPIGETPMRLHDHCSNDGLRPDEVIFRRLRPALLPCVCDHVAAPADCLVPPHQHTRLWPGGLAAVYGEYSSDLTQPHAVAARGPVMHKQNTHLKSPLSHLPKHPIDSHTMVGLSCPAPPYTRNQAADSCSLLGTFVCRGNACRMYRYSRVPWCDDHICSSGPGQSG